MDRASVTTWAAYSTFLWVFLLVVGAGLNNTPLIIAMFTLIAMCTGMIWWSRLKPPNKEYEHIRNLAVAFEKYLTIRYIFFYTIILSVSLWLKGAPDNLFVVITVGLIFGVISIFWIYKQKGSVIRSLLPLVWIKELENKKFKQLLVYSGYVGSIILAISAGVALYNGDIKATFINLASTALIFTAVLLYSNRIRLVKRA